MEIRTFGGATGVYIHAPIGHFDFAANSSMVFRRDSDYLQNVYVNPSHSMNFMLPQ